ncbi:MAG: N-formylglutamate amidohydrolase [Alphaproteobacteria bacterium]|nr:N-formylglutamate amidohydrolase [Alphaproteobacteria bacterium]
MGINSGEPAFEIPGVLWRRNPAFNAVPLVLDSPHSGSHYPDEFDYRCPLPVLRRAEDAYVDELYEAAPGHGATLIGAVFPRSYIDVNRASDDLDPSILSGNLPPGLNPRPATRVGLVRRHAQPGIPIYDRKLSPSDVLSRIERYHAPYHQVLEETCAELQAVFGAVWHINCHSMPSHGRSRDGWSDHGDFVLGDRDGTTCAGEFTEHVAGFLRGLGYDVRINEGYKGVEIVRRHGRPHLNRHSLQIEVDRALYMDQKTLEKVAGFDRLQADLSSLIGAVAKFVRERIEVPR